MVAPDMLNYAPSDSGRTDETLLKSLMPITKLSTLGASAALEDVGPKMHVVMTTFPVLGPPSK
jgi:hypothetical protein